MENVQFGFKFTFVAFLWGVSITSLKTHLYEVTHNRCKGKLGMLGKKKGSYICRLHQKDAKDRASHHLNIIKVVKVTQEKTTPFKNEILG
jgi:hypothetical protein